MRSSAMSPIFICSISGEAPAEYTAKPCVAIAGGRDAKSGLADVLAAYRLVMTANEQGIMDDIDIEFLHDFRVAHATFALAGKRVPRTVS